MKADWDAVVRKAINGHFMFERDFMEYHADRFDDHSLLFCDEKRPVAVLPAHRKGEDLCSHQGLPFAGLIWTQAVRMETMGEIFQGLVDHMKAHGLFRLFYTAVPAPYKHFQSDDDVYQLEQLGAAVTDTKVSCSARIGASPKVSATRRRYQHQAARNGLRIEQGIDLVLAYEMITEFLERMSYRPPIHTLSELQLLAGRFPGRIRCDGVFQGDVLVHAIVVFHSESCLRLQYTGTTEQGRKLHAQDFLFASLAQDPTLQSCWFDFGTSMDPSTGDLQSELHRYKESFGGRTSLIRTYMLNRRER